MILLLSLLVLMIIIRCLSIDNKYCEHFYLMLNDFAIILLSIIIITKL